MGKYQICIYGFSGHRLNEAAEYDIDRDLDAIDAAKSELRNYPFAAYAEVRRDGKIIWTWFWDQEERAKVASRTEDQRWHAANAALAAEFAAWGL